jgi:hypothetical protein
MLVGSRSEIHNVSRRAHRDAVLDHSSTKGATMGIARRLLFERMRHWAPELRLRAVLAFCATHDLAVDYRWALYEDGWFHVRIKRWLVSPDDPMLTVETGEVQRVRRRKWREIKRSQELPVATIETKKAKSL